MGTKSAYNSRRRRVVTSAPAVARRLDEEWRKPQHYSRFWEVGGTSEVVRPRLRPSANHASIGASGLPMRFICIAMSTELAIRTEGLSKRFGKRTAVEDLTITVQQGEVFGLLGPNGAGKTTTMAMLLGLVRPSAGRAFVLGYDMSRDAATALRYVGAMIEAPALYPYLSGRDNLRVLARADGLAETRVQAALEMVELTDRAADRFGGYSQGMKQRLAIAAALLAEPALVILDEPTNGLDPAGTVEIRHLVRMLAQGGRTVLISSHLLHEVEHICDQVAILKQGRLIAQGPVAELLHQHEGVVVRVDGEGAVEMALALLRPLEWIKGIEATDGRMLHISVPITRTAEINRLLVTQGIAVTELRPREATLEQVFLEMTS